MSIEIDDGFDLGIDNEIISPENSEEFLLRLTAFIKTFYSGYNFGTASGIMWFAALHNKCTLGAFTQALMAHITVTPRLPMPTPGEILERVGSTTSGDAWQKVLVAIRRYGSTYTVRFDDRKIHQAIEAMGGWPRVAAGLREGYEDEARKQFALNYSAQEDYSISESHLLLGTYKANSPIAFIAGHSSKLKIGVVQPSTPLLPFKSELE